MILLSERRRSGGEGREWAEGIRIGARWKFWPELARIIRHGGWRKRAQPS